MEVRMKRVILITLIVLTILSLLLSACGPADNSHGVGKSAKDKHKDKDKNTDRNNDREKNTDKSENAGKISICHKTGSAKNPYVQISVPDDALKDGHGSHEGDLIPAPAGGCPAN
jgi:predicted small secreted protein